MSLTGFVLKGVLLAIVVIVIAPMLVQALSALFVPAIVIAVAVCALRLLWYFTSL